jgi:hypothetical protein
MYRNSYLDCLSFPFLCPIIRSEFNHLHITFEGIKLKLSTALVLSTLALTSSSVLANTVVFEKQTENFETQACYTAATQGIDVAKELLKNNNVSYKGFKNQTTCNGMTIDRFSAKYFNSTSESNTVLPIIALTAVDQAPESQLCVDAATMGEKLAREKHDLKRASIKCNGINISTFLKDLKDHKVVKTANQSNIVASL